MTCTVTRSPGTMPVDFNRQLWEAAAGSGTDLDQVYHHARRVDIRHEIFMKGLGQIRENDQTLMARVHLSEPAAARCSDFLVHPATMDCATLVPFMMLAREQADIPPSIPLHIRRVRFFRPAGDRVFVCIPKASIPPRKGDIYYSDIEIYTDSGEPVLTMEALASKEIRSRDLITRLQETAATDQPPAAAAAGKETRSAAAAGQSGSGAAAPQATAGTGGYQAMVAAMAGDLSGQDPAALERL